MQISIESIETKLNNRNLSVSDMLSLRKVIGTSFRIHPLGFISSTLLTEGDRKLRLHYWPIDGGKQQSPDCQIHDHLFSFKSWVISGAVENIEYTIDDTEGKEFSVYQTSYTENHSKLNKTASTHKLVEKNRSIYENGEAYAIDAGVLHETVRISKTPAFTVLITKDISKNPPKVYGPLAGEDIYLYERRILDESEVTDFIK